MLLQIYTFAAFFVLLNLSGLHTRFLQSIWRNTIIFQALCWNKPWKRHQGWTGGSLMKENWQSHQQKHSNSQSTCIQSAEETHGLWAGLHLKWWDYSIPLLAYIFIKTPVCPIPLIRSPSHPSSPFLSDPYREESLKPCSVLSYWHYFLFSQSLFYSWHLLFSHLAFFLTFSLCYSCSVSESTHTTVWMFQAGMFWQADEFVQLLRIFFFLWIFMFIYALIVMWTIQFLR